jgi:HNH endonuclease
MLSDCWIWPGPMRNRYGRAHLNIGQGYAHRAMWIICYGEIPEGAQVLHHCDNPACVNPEHMFLGDHNSNMLDKRMKRRGRNQWTGPLDLETA